jgi:hypothetical protein
MFMNILAKARRLEAKLARTFDGAAQRWTRSGARGPLEVLHAIVEAAEEGLEPAGRGTHVFPFNRIKVSILAPSRDARARFAALFDAEPTLQERIGARLRDAGCEGAHPQIKIVYVDRAAPDWTTPDVHVEFDRVTAAEIPPERPSAPEPLRLTIVNGAAEKPAYVFSLGRINLGRCAEIRDSRNRLIRTNHVAFSETASDPNSTVSRCHAHIEYASDLRQYRICDDGSAHGTGLIRNGRTVNVPSGARGIRMRSGDELLLGEARLRVRIEPD